MGTVAWRWGPGCVHPTAGLQGPPGPHGLADAAPRKSSLTAPLPRLSPQPTGLTFPPGMTMALRLVPSAQRT